MSNAENAPGVRIIEAAPVARPANTGPTLTGIAGVSRRGRVDVAQIVTDWSQYVSLYGGYSVDAVDMGVYVGDFFSNGGASMRVLRIASGDAVGASNTADVINRDGDPFCEVHAISPGAWGNDLAVKTALVEVLSTEQQRNTDFYGNALPNTGSNILSENVSRIPVSNINAYGVGDVVDVFTPLGVYQATTVVLAVDIISRSVVVARVGGMDITGSGFYLRSCSQHRVRTTAKATLASNQTELLLDSVVGLNRGSLLTAVLHSHCETAADRSISARCNLIVERVSGNTVYFTAGAATSTESDIPAVTNAALRYTTSVGNYIDFVAQAAGPSGNKVSIKVVTGALANGISVAGKTVTISTDGTYTLDAIKTDIDANANAHALVSVFVTGDDTETPAEALAATRLTGGAQLLVISQEFGLEVYLGADLAERHDYLSAISTNPDFVTTRLGGDPDTFTPVSGSQSNYVILTGANDVVDSADIEFLAQPRALVSVGLAEGTEGGELTDADWIGGSNPNTGLTLLVGYEDIKLAIAPGVTSPDVQTALIELCKSSGRVVTLLDPPSDARSATDILVHRINDLGTNNRFGQLGSTWVRIRDPRAGALKGALITIPCTPGFAALVAQGQAEIGPHGSPGGRVPATWVELLFNPSQDDAGLLDKNGVTVFRVVSGLIKCFGDCTLLQIEDPRQFGNVSRMLNQLIHDLESDLSVVLFQPGNENVFGQVESIINRRLLAYHKAGALYPQSSPSQAFRAVCNATTTSPLDIASGRFYAEVELSPSTLAKQIILRLSVSAGGVKIV